MGIKVLPPDINKSDIDFKIEPDPKSLEGKAIRFGFTAIKNVGTAAIDNILFERTGGGEYKSFTDFIARVDTQKANKKVLESLIKVGAFDAYGKRAVILDEIDRIRAKVGKSSAEKASNQTGLFDNLIQEEVSIVDDWQSTKAEFNNRELMEMERELLGIYLREHPSQKILKTARTEWTKPLSELSEYKDQKVSVAAIIKTARTVVTKAKQQEMAFLLLTDEGGEIEAVVFPKTYAQVKSFLIPNSVVIVKGKVEEREDRLSLIIDSIELVGDHSSNPSTPGVQGSQTPGVNVITVPRGTSKATLLALNKLLQNNRGDDHITLVFQNSHDSRELKLPFGINYSSSLKKEIAQLLQITPLE